VFSKLVQFMESINELIHLPYRRNRVADQPRIDESDLTEHYHVVRLAALHQHHLSSST
jgi:hypothetical protein